MRVYIGYSEENRSSAKEREERGSISFHLFSTLSLSPLSLSLSLSP
jgi:hypothetical protein